MDKKDLELLYEGVLFNPSSNGDEHIEFKGKTYIRFMDGFYIDRSTHKLTQEQVFALCRSRAKNPNLINNGPGNEEVKSVFNRFISTISPDKVLEIGAGTSPTLSISDKSTYILADADEEVVKKNMNFGRRCVHFSKNNPLEFENGYFDLMLAVFVFHFMVYPLQIKEISRCLKDNGVLLANVYQLTEVERKEIENLFSNENLKCIRIKDPSHCCKENEFWLISSCNNILEIRKNQFLKTINLNQGT